ncbi:plasmid fertility inhibition factor family protein [Anaerosinus massiliensis]|uniref:plasmid fertility inhibition factor family protein n=1 Tax=Massilibacillus massiliensis TaxID=1806837 RepID=UPI000DA63053|nr:hypothetical protein [Massilibacillus massiliensis]
MDTFYKLEKIIYSMAGVFRIPTDYGEMFMRIERSNDLNDERFIVEVDAQRFLSLWRNTTDRNHSEIANGNISTWKKDRKFPEAEDGFSHGEINPVPLAEVSVFFSGGKKPCINVCNGVTRTIYLLTANAEKFPVECRGIDQAKLLQKFAGLPNRAFKSVQELIPE